jgi:hypothetical protein
VAKKQITFEKRRREMDKKLKAEEKRKRRETKKKIDAMTPLPGNSMERSNRETSEARDE